MKRNNFEQERILNSRVWHCGKKKSLASLVSPKNYTSYYYNSTMDIYYKINLLRLNDASFLRLNPYFDLGLEVDDDYDKNILNMLV